MLRKIFLLAVTIFLIFSRPSFAFWVWTPETNRWVNPKYSVKDTPQEQLDYARGLYTNKEYEKAINEFNKLIKYYPKAKEAAESQFYVGKCWEDQGQLYKAFKAYQVVIDKYPYSERNAEIVELQYKIGEQFLGGQQRRSKFVKVVLGSEYDVIDVFRTVIKNAPYGKLAAPAQYKIGLYLQEKGMYQEARDEFEKVVNDYPDSEWVKAAKYQIAVVDSKRSTAAQYDQNVTKSAVEEFNEFVKQYPDAELSDNAKDQIKSLRDREAENNMVIAEFYAKQKNDKAAEIYYNIVLNDYGDSRWAVKALEKLRQMDLNKQKGKK